MAVQISGKVTAATVATGITTLVISVLAPHLGARDLDPDVQGLISAVITAAVTFAAGYLAKHRVVETVEREVREVLGAYPRPASEGDQPGA